MRKKRKRNTWHKMYGYTGRSAEERKKRHDYALAQNRLLDEQMRTRKR